VLAFRTRHVDLKIDSKHGESSFTACAENKDRSPGLFLTGKNAWLKLFMHF